MNSFISFKKQPSVCVLHIIEVRLSLFLTHPYTSFCFPLNSCKKFNSESCDEIDLAQIEIPICTSQFIMRSFRRFTELEFFFLLFISYLVIHLILSFDSTNFIFHIFGRLGSSFFLLYTIFHINIACFNNFWFKENSSWFLVFLLTRFCHK